MNKLKSSLFVFVICTVWPFVVMAEQAYLLTEKTYKALEAAQQQMADEQYSQAEVALIKLVSETTDGSYERAVVLQTLGYLYTETGDYARATERFRAALALNALPEEVNHNLRYNLAQLLIADGQFQQGINLLEQWLQKEDGPENRVYVLLATAHYQLKQFTKTVENIRIAISRDNAPKEEWFRLQLAAHLEMQQYDSAINVLETLLIMKPKDKTYWQQLSSLYARQEKQLTALAVTALVKRLDLGDADTVMQLSNMYRYLRIPFKSGELLQQSLDNKVISGNFENLEKLADSWLSAREGDRAAVVLEKMRGADNSGETDLKLARVYVSEERWQSAQEPIVAAIDKLSSEKQGDAYLLAGMIAYHLEDIETAEQRLQQALRFDKQRSQAAQWLRHLQQRQPEEDV
ncbi:TPR domain protein, putative component of TonB system [Methylophaga frappieri]|uniref:TPR domain protein, putative component of TonB system n=1 Tax=Methylophaga frappieri (strain ATCC BAA-2434 / DSM 25690 / JAM7) TaxID=754477 RepID=I1YHZ2_METFJ|nr:tetratricopeptide repeat protein [Methylophaga frappieri]AFJ02535.1 TPR domain protein, putative component of TonB system [Methylophaga frappieri]